MPITWIFAFIFAGVLWSNRKWISIGLVLLYFFSNSFISMEALRLYEMEINEEEINFPYEIGLVLGGFSSFDARNERMEFNQASDRLIHAIRLYKEEKIAKIMISGGSGEVFSNLREADYTLQFLKSLQIPEEDIIIENESRNTYQNLVNSKKIIGEMYSSAPSILLITSATHIRRSAAIAEKLEFELTPFPVDHIAGDRFFTPDHLLLPQAEALNFWNILTHEWLGFLVYKVKGYV